MEESRTYTEQRDMEKPSGLEERVYVSITHGTLGHLRWQEDPKECIQSGQIQILGSLEWTVIDTTLIHVVSVERIQMTGGAWNVGRGDTA